MLSYLHGREARPSSVAWVIVKSLCQTVVFWSLFLFVFPAGIVAIEDLLGWSRYRWEGATFEVIGVALFVLGGSLGITSSMVMSVWGKGTPLPADCARELVIVGPYRYLRNPMAVAGLVQGVAVGLYLGSASVIAYAVVGGPIWHLFVRPWEEADLERRFGEPYRRYRQAVRCWIPKFPGYSAKKEADTSQSPATPG